MQNAFVALLFIQTGHHLLWVRCEHTECSRECPPSSYPHNEFLRMFRGGLHYIYQRYLLSEPRRFILGLGGVRYLFWRPIPCFLRGLLFTAV